MWGAPLILSLIIYVTLLAVFSAGAFLFKKTYKPVAWIILMMSVGYWALFICLELAPSTQKAGIRVDLFLLVPLSVIAGIGWAIYKVGIR